MSRFSIARPMSPAASAASAARSGLSLAFLNREDRVNRWLQKSIDYCGIADRRDLAFFIESGAAVKPIACRVCTSAVDEQVMAALGKRTTPCYCLAVANDSDLPVADL